MPLVHYIFTVFKKRRLQSFKDIRHNRIVFTTKLFEESKKNQEMDTSFVANVHEVVFATFLATYCSPALNILISKFFKAHMAIYREGNVSYNTVMVVNTILMDFFVKHQRMFSRNIGMEFVEHVLSRLIGYEGFWQLVNRLNVHIFYLTYRPQILVILSDALLGTYGSRNFNRISSKIPPYCIGEVECEEFRTNRSKFISLDTF